MRVHTFDEFIGQRCEVAIVSMVYSGMSSFIRPKMEMLEWVASRGEKCSIIFLRESQYSIHMKPEIKSGMMTINEVPIKNFIAMYKLVQTILEAKEIDMQQ